MLDIYKSVYKLEGQPFRLSPDYRFSFGHQTYDDAKSYLKYAISEGEGIVAITGAPGTGKTTLIASLISEIDEQNVRVGVVTNVQLGSSGLVDMVADAFSLPPGRDNISKLNAFLRIQTEQDRRVILIVDEAQGLSPDALEELRLLSNLQHNTQLMLQVFLVGQEPLMDIIRTPGMEQFHQRLIAAAQLKPLDPQQTKDYILHRLHCVGWDNDPEIFEDVFGLIYKFSGGIPRRINLISHRLFLQAGLNTKHKLLGGDALHVIVELHKEGLLTPVARRALGEYVGGIKNLMTS